ncbi:hypothetical protein SDRG_11403 [Saprolegnia diclina VS20]|uniref:Ricin B lectin domain-containing protein n=1 Tax=Saprolegnia diclina (strain VS20) TaxID=1156394 RepID=T0PZC5_SAPDV|nr:hypothetical protein SDRG_11403 [Saprolegnia diclina VS20]EQC30924.1 hypothetical protein SDRG_11403 [Saprolegnia diclina VS20]|eukprot:XP_008615662.1 hypothetical protein SDRG_11403 [Saprolegnia diclina VS20]
MLRLVRFAAVLASAVAQFPPGTCNKELTDATYACAKVFPGPTGWILESLLKMSATAGHLSICFGDHPECNDLQRLVFTPAGDCTVQVYKANYVNLRTIVTPCPNPLPPRLQEKQLCTASGLIASEYYGNVYTDVVRSNNNEVFVYNVTGKTLMAKSNGQCLEAVPNMPQPNYGYGTVRTAACDATKELQQWIIADSRIYASQFGSLTFCLSTDQFQRGAMASVGPCNLEQLSSTSFVDCTTTKPKYVRLTSARGNRLSEYYSNLYVNAPANNFNELFTWDQANKMLKVASNNQCLDAYKDANGKVRVHTYACDVNNGNQKWNFNPSTKTLEHATHAGQCLDADPTYADRHAQMWACTPNNPNQQWSLDTFSS